jgi:hypothetical protein
MLCLQGYEDKLHQAFNIGPTCSSIPIQAEILDDMLQACGIRSTLEQDT